MAKVDLQLTKWQTRAITCLVVMPLLPIFNYFGAFDKSPIQLTQFILILCGFYCVNKIRKES